MRKPGLNMVLILFIYASMAGVWGISYAETLVVTSCLDEPALDASVGPEMAEGVVTLRSAIEYANHPYSDTEHTICFELPGEGLHRIELNAPLNSIVKPIVINGYSQRGSSYADEEHQEVLCVELSGAQAGKGADGLVLRSEAKGSVIKGLAITGFSGHGIVLDEVQDVVIFGNHIGTDSHGERSVPNHGHGIGIYGGANNRIGGSERRERNLISGNHQSGISIGDSHGARICGNMIGSDITGTRRLGNKASGIAIIGGGDHEIGGHRDHAGNVVSGNEGAGITLRESYANRLEGNIIGLDVGGSHPVPNGVSGIEIEQGSSRNCIGGTEEVFCNIISGNQGSGIVISHADKNKICANVIGLTRTGEAAPNHAFGIHVMNGASRNTIGGSELGAGNTVSGNSYSAIVVSEGFDTRIQGNTIGQDPTRTYDAPNGGHGILLQNAQGTIIGGGSLGDSNQIVGNKKFAIKCDSGCSNTVIGNALFGNERKWALQLINEANNSIEAPRLSVDTHGAVVGTVSSAPHEEHIICLYSNQQPGRKEGAHFLGQQLIKTDAEGTAQFRLNSGVQRGGYLTATITRKATGDTSRFSNDVELKGEMEVQCERTPVMPCGDDQYCSYTLTVLGGAELDQPVVFREYVPDGLSFVSMAQESGPEFALRHPRVGESGVVEGECSRASGQEAVFRIVLAEGPTAVRKMPRDEAYFGMNEGTLARGIACKLRDHMPLAQQVILSDGSHMYELELPGYQNSVFVRTPQAHDKKTGVYDHERLSTLKHQESERQKDVLASPSNGASSPQELETPSDSDSDDLNQVRSTLIDEDELQRLNVNPLRYQNNALSSRITQKWTSAPGAGMNHKPTINDDRRDEDFEYAHIDESDLEPAPNETVTCNKEAQKPDMSDRQRPLASKQDVMSLLQHARPHEDETLGRIYCVEDYPPDPASTLMTREYDEDEDPVEIKASIAPIFTQEELDYLREYELYTPAEVHDRPSKPTHTPQPTDRQSGARQQARQRKTAPVYEYSSPWGSVAGAYYGASTQSSHRYDRPHGAYGTSRSSYAY